MFRLINLCSAVQGSVATRKPLVRLGKSTERLNLTQIWQSLFSKKVEA